MSRVLFGNKQRGFSTIELLIVIAVGLIVAGFAIPKFQTVTRGLRIAGDQRDLSGSLAQAKMRAAGDFTQARVYVNLADNTYRIQTWNKTASCWRPEGDNAAGCSTALNPGAGNVLSSGVTFGFPAGTTPPANTQPAMVQAPACRDASASALGGGAVIANTACIVFNSRGISIDNTSTPTNWGAFYITDNTSVCGVTVNATGTAQSWATAARSISWHSTN